MDYFYFSSLLQNKKFKKLYRLNFNAINKVNASRLGIWGTHEINKREGIIEDGLWSWRNTMNTHSYCFHDLYYLYINKTGKDLDFSNELYWKYRLNDLFTFINENWELFFTLNIESKYYNNFNFRCNSSWIFGQITTIACLYKLRELFSEYSIKEIEYSLDRGDVNDFNGYDIIVHTKCEKSISIQVKGGSYYKINNDFVIISSVNSLTSIADYYCFVDIVKDNTSILLLKNKKEGIDKMNKNFYFKEELFDNRLINENMETSQILMDMLNYSYSNRIIMNILNEGSENSVNWEFTPEKVINIVIINFKDKNLPIYLKQKFDELKDSFQ